MALSGNARVNALTFTPSPLAFGDVIVGAPTNLSLNIENPGPLDATLSISRLLDHFRSLSNRRPIRNNASLATGSLAIAAS